MLQALLDRTFQTRAIRVRLPDGRELVAGPGEPELTAVLTDARAALAIAANPDLALGEAFMDGTFRVEGGSIYDFLQLTASQLALRPRASRLTLLQRIRRGAEQANDRLHARSNVHHHYDLTVDFYRLFLDEDLQYSCAFFETPDATLEQAQAAKKRRLIDKLLLEPGQTALDIGCGWGGLGLSMVERGARVTGVTLSTEQHRTANERAAARGVSDRADFRLQDYRDLDQTFDRIISVGMFEHVGAPNYQEYFDAVARLLADDGVAVIHSIGRKTPPSRTQPWIRKYIFPGGYIPALSEVLPAVERAGLWVTDVEVLRLHYAETLRHWRERFLARRDEALAMYDERFCRMWEFYLACSEVAFRELGHMVFQLQLTKTQTAAPLSRDYLCG
ncbi:Cyclopropane-fatty-acyl-phospholipid synthase [compost metagenome]